MGSSTSEIAIERSPEEVWHVVGNFGGLTDWLPGVESCRLEGDTRILGMMGIEISEALVSRDDATRTLVYSVVASPIPLESHRATITVHPDPAGARVTWEVEVTPDEQVDMLTGIYRQGLDALKAHVEK